MVDAKRIIDAANEVPGKVDLDALYPAVATLRNKKNLSWREIADFLNGQGVDTDHSKVFRMYCKLEQQKAFVVPSMNAYVKALEDLSAAKKISSPVMRMLKFHYLAHNRTVTYTQLAASVIDQPTAATEVPVTHTSANLQYGRFGRVLGEKLKMQFSPADDRGKQFFSSSIGIGNPLTPTGGQFELTMHHELAKAIFALKWFE